MLTHLRIKNIALIEQIELEFSDGFTVLTGETGAGKSVLINALMLLSGERASPTLVRTGAKEGEVEALFDITAHPDVGGRLASRELLGEEPEVLLVRRVISHNGRGKVVINNRLATVTVLREVMRGLIEISGQHEQQSLLQVENHLPIIDRFGDYKKELRLYQDYYSSWISLKSAYQKATSDEGAALKQLDFLRFQLQELDEITPEPDELEKLQEEMQRLRHADQLCQQTQKAERALYSGDDAACDMISEALSAIESLTQYDPALSPLAERLLGLSEELSDVAQVVQRYSAQVEVDPERLAWLEDRVHILERLCRKHGVAYEELLILHQNLRQQVDSLDGSGNSHDRLKEKLQEVGCQLEGAAAKLTRKRQQTAKKLSSVVESEAHQIELAGARFIIQVVAREEDGEKAGASANRYNPQGGDDVEFLWSANPGEQPRPLAKIASGGELSRLMLAIKSAMRAKGKVATCIFDEVDTGVGGKAADRIGVKLQCVAETHQVLTITHLAPIAARADHHLLVRKSLIEDRTVSDVISLDNKARVSEIARMIDGAAVGDESQDAAKQAAIAMLKRTQ